jgi:hypothetical protein
VKHNKSPARAEDAVPICSEAEWEKIIRRDLGRTVEGIIATGRHLKQAQTQLSRDDFASMCARLGLSARSVQRFVAIAEDERLTTATHVSRLPPSWGTLYLLTRLDDQTFDRLIQDGTINAGMERKAIEGLKQDHPGRRSSQQTPADQELAQPDNGKPSPEAMEARQKENAEAEAKRLEEAETAAESPPEAPPDAGADLVDELEVGREAVERLMAEKRALESRVAELEAKQTGMSLSEFQVAIKKWEDVVETQRDIIAQRDNEIATLRAGGATPPEASPQTLAQMCNRAVDTLALLNDALNAGPADSKKVSAQHLREVREMLTRLRGLRDRVEFYSGNAEVSGAPGNSTVLLSSEPFSTS